MGEQLGLSLRTITWGLSSVLSGGDTDVWDTVADTLGVDSGKDAMKALGGDMVPLGTVTTEDVAKVVSYLTSSDSDYVTGQTLLIDGGMQVS
ncbi:hypothetical protein OQA88_4301 [Cercophora sp. LCS_1]